MATVTVSPKFQVVIPSAIRKALSLEIGLKLEAMQVGDQIVFVPLRSARSLRGFLRGIDTTVTRDRDRGGIRPRGAEGKGAAPATSVCESRPRRARSARPPASVARRPPRGAKRRAP